VRTSKPQELSLGHCPAPVRPPLFATADPNSDDDDAGTDPSNASQLTSPSVTSPPYWVHGHQRTVSNVSVESVLPSDAITLQDNETDDGPCGSNIYGRDRNRACWAKSVDITDYITVNGSATNIGAFVVWNIRVETLNVRAPLALAMCPIVSPCEGRRRRTATVAAGLSCSLDTHTHTQDPADPHLCFHLVQGSYFFLKRRYSDFDDLRRRLMQTFPSFEAAVPVLPPKSVMSKFKPKFLAKRRAGLQYFLK